MFPILYSAGTSDFSSGGIALTDAGNVLVRMKINTASYLMFDMLRTSPQWELIHDEDIIKVEGQLYVVKIIKDGSKSGKPYGSIECTHVWWEVSEKKHLSHAFFIGQSATEILRSAFSGISYGSNFIVISQGITTPTDIDMTKTNPLSVASRIIERVGGELYVDNFSAALVGQLGTDTGERFTFSKNMKSLDRTVDTTQLVTRLYPYGESGLEITSITGRSYIDSPYINNYPYIHAGYIDYRDIKTPEALLEQAQREFSSGNYHRIDIPKSAYKCDIVDLWKCNDRTGTEYKPKLGDYIIVYDEALNIDGKIRVVGYDYYPYEIQRSVVTLGNPPKTVGEIIADISGFQDHYAKKEVPVDVTFNEEVLENIINTEINTEINNIVEYNVVAADTAHLMNIFAKDLRVQDVETNFDALDVRLPAPEELTREYIKIQNQTLEFRSAKLSPTETEHYKNSLGDYYYWTEIEDAGGEDESEGTIKGVDEGKDENKQAYKYWSTVDPVVMHRAKFEEEAKKEFETKFEEINPEELEEFKVEFRKKYAFIVRKTQDDVERLVVKFDETHQHKIPRMIWGIGEDEYGRGAGIVEKTSTHMFFGMTPGQGDEIGGYRVSPTDGPEYYDIDLKKWMKPGLHGDMLNAIVQDSPPTPEQLNNINRDVLIFQYDPNGAPNLFGESAFQAAQRVEGFVGSEEEWLESFSSFGIAKQGGFAGSQSAFNDALTNVGDISGVLDAIIGEEL